VTSALLALWLATATPEIAGDCTCPTPAEVREQLAVMTSRDDGDGSDERAAHRANISGLNQAVHIELLDGDGTLLAERTLERTGTCGDVAGAVAVVLATWETRLNPKLATPPRPFASPSAVPAVQPPANAPSPQAMPFDAGLAVLASLVNGEAALGARLEACLFPGSTGVGLHAALTGTSTHTQSITTPAAPTSAAEWMRAALSLGPDYRLGHAAPGLDVHAGVALALLHVQGAGLPRTASDTTLQWGLAAGLRGLWAWNNAVGWLGVDVFVYPGEDRLTIGNYGAVGNLPRLEAQLAAGIGLGRFR
jgi:hypothetical protein